MRAPLEPRPRQISSTRLSASVAPSKKGTGEGGGRPARRAVRPAGDTRAGSHRARIDERGVDPVRAARRTEGHPAPRRRRTARRPSDPALGMFDACSKLHTQTPDPDPDSIDPVPVRSLDRSAQHPAQRQGQHDQGARRRGVARGQGGQARARRPARSSPHPQRQGHGARQDARRLQSRGGVAGDVSPPGAAQTRAVQGRSGREGEGRRRRGRRLGARVRLRRVVTRVSV